MVGEKDIKLDIIKGAVYLIGFILLFEVLLIPVLLLMGGGGAEDSINLSKFMFYGVIALTTILFLYSIKISRAYVVNKSYKPWFDAWIFDPEKSILANFKNIPILRFFHRINSSIILSYLFGILIFVPFIFLGSYIQQTTFEGSIATTLFPQTAFPGSTFFTEQQVTETADFGLAVVPASPSETLVIISIVSVIMLIGGYMIYIKKLLPQGTMYLFRYVIAPMIGAIGHLVQHFFRYGGSDVSLMAVFIFGMLTAYLYVITASVILPFVYHDSNNGVFKLFEMGLLGSDASIGILVMILSMIFALFVIIYWKKYVKRQEEPQPV